MVPLPSFSDPFQTALAVRSISRLLVVRGEVTSLAVVARI